MRAATDQEWREAEEAIRNYGEARRIFCEIQERMTDTALLSGNDNKVGIAGEFWARKFYRQNGYEITEVPRANDEGYDFRCRKDNSFLRVSVKVISDESKRGRQLRLRESPNWDVLCIVLLDSRLALYKIGTATRTQFAKAQEFGRIKLTPVVSRSWLNPGGWLSRYGHVTECSRTYFDN